MQIADWLGGQVMVGGCVSFIVTVNVQGADMLPEVSVALQLTVVVPTGKNEPEAGVHVTVCPGQLSELVGGVNVFTAPH